MNNCDTLNMLTVCVRSYCRIITLDMMACYCVYNTLFFKSIKETKDGMKYKKWF